MADESSLTRQVDLVRVSNRKGLPTFGVLTFQGIPQLVTLELPDFGNKPKVSCIPLGSYACEKVESPKVHGNTFLVKNVPGRTGILFHHGNTVKDTQGCILVGSEFMFVNGDYGITESKKAFLKFMELLSGAEAFQLTIRSAYP